MESSRIIRSRRIWRTASIERRSIPADDRAYTVFTVQYDENDNLIKFTAALGNGMVLGYRQLFYDDQNRWIREEHYYGDGAMSSYSEAEYDEDGLPWKERVYSVNDKNEVRLSTVNVFEFQNGSTLEGQHL